MMDKKNPTKTAEAKRIAALEAQLAKAKRETAVWKKKYRLLANSKLGKLTLKYWKLMERLRSIYRSKTLRNALKKIPGLRPAVLFLRRLRKKNSSPKESAIPKRSRWDLPVVAVIIPTYKPNNYLEACVDSVLKQNYPRKKIVIRLAVNGDNKEYYQQLRREYGFRKGFDVVYTPIKGAQAGRAAALERTKEECLCFLDDDDLLMPDFLSGLACHITGDVHIAATGNIDFDEDTGKENTDTYINLCLRQAGEGIHEDLLTIMNLFVTLWGKVIRTELLRGSFDPKYFSVKNADDVIYWCSCFDQLKGKVYVSPANEQIFYKRRLAAGSVTRPDKDKQFVFFGQDRVDAINVLTDIFFSPCSDRCREFTLSKIQTQVRIMRNYYKDLSLEEKQRYLEEVVFPAPSPLMNKSSFALKKGIAFCQLFSPYVCASSYVSPRRLAEIEGLEGQNINWEVIGWELDNCRKQDEKYFKYYAQARFSKKLLLKGPGYFGEDHQEKWAMQAFEKVKNQRCHYIYSRSMWPSTHHAAYLYKKAHPNVKWYAEFGDPLYTDTTGARRAATKHYEGAKEYLTNYWRDLENMVYELADVVIFTNENQRDYMLRTSPDVHRFPDLRSRSLVMAQPPMDHRYCLLEESDFQPKEGYINIGYFGSFYARRNESDLFRLLKNEKVFLHVFTYKTFVSITEQAPEYADRVKVYPLVPYLQMLNVCSKMDYLLVSDMVFPYEINPFLPSKLADYRTAQVPVLALVHGNSPLSRLELPDLIKVGEDDDSIIATLKKRS